MSFNFNFDDDDDVPFNFNDIAKIIQNMQQNLIRQLREQGIDPENMDLSDLQNIFGNMQPGDNPNMERFGFSISMGPDGQPNIKPLDGSNIPFNMANEQRQGNGFEEPFVDAFFSDSTGEYQIIAEVQGVEQPDHVHLKLDDDDLTIHAETGPFKYRTSLKLEHAIDESTLNYKLRNGVLEITAQAQS